MATIFRFYNPTTTNHHYTTDKNEVAALRLSDDWNYEGAKWKTNDGDINVYRFFNKVDGRHLLTSDEADKPIKSYTSQITAVKNKALTENKSQATTTSSEASVSEVKSDLEIKLAEIEDMHERSVITKTERDKLREKALGLE